MCSDDIYYIVFKESERSLWWMRWLKSGFGHCFLLRAENGKWIKYESGHGVLRIDIINDYANLIDNCIIVKVKAKTRKKWVLINSCVGLVKLLTGLGGGALTPYQLYKRVNSCRY